MWGPEKIADEGIGSREDWMLKTSEKWHGFGKLAPGFNMLDPIKATIITPGLDLDGKFAETGIPAAIVTKYLAEHGVIVEKMRAVFVLHHVHHRHHQGPMEYAADRAAAVQGRLRQEPADVAHPARVLRQKHPRYERSACATCASRSTTCTRRTTSRSMTTEMYLSDMQPAMKPSDAFATMAHHEIDRVAIDHLQGRVTSVLVTPYPPGIPLLIPGERFNATIVRYLQFARDFNNRFPGFETDIHGLVKDEDDGRYYVDCVRQTQLPSASAHVLE